LQNLIDALGKMQGAIPEVALVWMLSVIRLNIATKCDRKILKYATNFR
jgi:hypothetical protein